MSVKVIHADMLDVLPTLDAASVHAVVTDPPYEIGFMGRAWDRTGIAFRPETWAAVLRVLKPGAHLIAFGGTRTEHRMTCAIEDAGFEIRDKLQWIYGSGFPKSQDVSKLIDKARDDRAAILAVTSFMADAAERRGITRADVDTYMGTSDMAGWWLSRLLNRCACPKWDQWLKLKTLLGLSTEMDHEVCRLNERKGKPGEAWDQREVMRLSTDGSGSGSAVGMGSSISMAKEFAVTTAFTPEAAQWLGWGTALKPAYEPIILARKPLIGTVAANVLAHGVGGLNIDACMVGTGDDRASGGGPGDNRQSEGWGMTSGAALPEGGRWPANVLHDGSPEVLDAFAAFGERASRPRNGGVYSAAGSETVYGKRGDAHMPALRGITGSAARFFYSAKADKADRADSTHPTIKPVDLIRWLVQLVTPPGGHVLDPFAGSGTTGEAAMLLGFDCTLIEADAQHVADIQHRIKRWSGMDAPLFAEVS